MARSVRTARLVAKTVRTGSEKAGGLETGAMKWPRGILRLFKEAQWPGLCCALL
jgi:hypothetical protein